MAVQVLLLLLLLLGLTSGSGSSPDLQQGWTELRRVRNLAAHPRYGGCWARALEHLDTRCRELTAESQRRLALRFTECHLISSGKDFPSCPEGSEVSRCTAGMDTVAFNTYTEFFTHTHSICHHLQAEAWQSKAETTMYRLTESSAGVADQLQSTRQMAEDLMTAQSAALQAQQEILNNGEELRVTLRDSTQGLQTVFSDLSSVSQQQQVALSELFNRVSFLQNFLLTEAHSLTSCFYHAAALCSAYLLTSTQRSSRARLVLLTLVGVNFYLERRIYQFVMNSDYPQHKHMELVTLYVSVLRRVVVCVGVCVLLFVCVRYRDPMQQNLQLLQQLQETQRSLQEALQQAMFIKEQQTTKIRTTHQGVLPVMSQRTPNQADQSAHLQRRLESRKRKDKLRGRRVLKEEEDDDDDSSTEDIGCRSDCTLTSTQNTAVNPSSHPCHSSLSPLVYSILVEDKQSRYSLRSRRSDTH